MGENLNDFFWYFFSPLQVIHHVSAKANDEGAACKATEVSPAHCFHSGFSSCHCIQGERMTHTQAATNTTLMVMLRLKKWHSRDERNTSSVLSVSRSTYSSADSWSYFIHHIYFLVKLLFFRSVYKMQWIVHLKDITFLMLTNKYSNIIVFFFIVTSFTLLHSEYPTFTFNTLSSLCYLCSYTNFTCSKFCHIFVVIPHSTRWQSPRNRRTQTSTSSTMPSKTSTLWGKLGSLRVCSPLGSKATVRASLLGFKYCHFKLRYHMECNIWYDGVSISINVLLFFFFLEIIFLV